MNALLDQMRDLIQEDVNNRGLRADPTRNLVSACPDDFRHACQSLAQTSSQVLGIVTGFFIPTGQFPHPRPLSPEGRGEPGSPHPLPAGGEGRVRGAAPCGETDGPLGAVYLARALFPLGIRIVIATDDFCAQAIQIGLTICGLRNDVPLVVLPTPQEAAAMSPAEYYQYFRDRAGPLTHLLAIERVGPSHTLESLLRQLEGEGALGQTYLDFLDAVPAAHQDRCHTMRGRDITAQMSPAHLLFEAVRQDPAITILGIGDGGNEIGMGKISWEVIKRNIPGGGLVACRVPTRHLIVCGISNWGGYALAAGVRLLRGKPPEPGLFDLAIEHKILAAMVEHGPLVDGVSGQPTATVDGLAFEKYAEVLTRLAKIR